MTNFKITINRKTELNLCCVYKIEFPSGKVYIGQTVNFYRRKINHRNCECKDQPLLYNAMVNESDFTISILKKCKKNKLDFYEKKFINIYGAAKPEKGLNLQLGGVHGLFNQEAKNKRIWSRKPVLQIDENGQVVKEWASVTEACIGVGCKALKTVKTVIKTNRLVNGYFWKFKNN